MNAPEPTLTDRVTGSADSPIVDSITRGIVASAIVEFLQLLGVTPDAIDKAPTLVLVSSFALFGLFDYVRRNGLPWRRRP